MHVDRNVLRSAQGESRRWETAWQLPRVRRPWRELTFCGKAPKVAREGFWIRDAGWKFIPKGM